MRKTPILALLWLDVGIALAQAPPMSPEFRINTYTPGNQARPSVAVDSSGAFVVVWQSDAQDGSGAGVFGQLYDAASQPLGSEFPVNSYTTGVQQHPSIAMDGASGRFVVVWQSALQDGSGAGVFGRRFDADGSPLGVEFQVNTSTAGDQSDPDVAVDDQGNFTVAWRHQVGAGDPRVVGRNFDAEGSPLGGEFQVSGVSVYGGSYVPAVAAGTGGEFVVAWSRVNYYGGSDVMARHYEGPGLPTCGPVAVGWGSSTAPDVAISANGKYVVAFDEYGELLAARMHSCTPLGEPFLVDTEASPTDTPPSVAADGPGDFLVVWASLSEGSAAGVYGRRFDGDAQPVGSEFLVNSFTTGYQGNPAAAMNGGGKTLVAWSSAHQDQSGLGVYARLVESQLPQALDVDLHPAIGGPSNVNGVLEPDETVRVEPTWQNTLSASIDLTGEASSLTGPPGPVYEISDGTADYGSIAAGQANDCAETTGDCFEVSVLGARPADHWDAAFEETLSTGEIRSWTLHVGESFTDVSTANPFYGAVETALHRGVTAGCGASVYCPGDPVRRDQMAALILRAVRGRLYVPPSCAGVFQDVPCPGPFADWIEEVFAAGITGGCAPASYCPSSPITRAQMAAFLLKAEHGAGYVPPTCQELFADVPCPGPFADWIEQLFHEGISAGCGGGNYCPSQPVNRGQMATFLVRTFGLQLYGP
jgi:hypothetical protein